MVKPTKNHASRPSLYVMALLFVGLGSLVTGCQSVRENTFTGQLWDNQALVDHFEPAPKSNLKLFQPRRDGDLLVVYDEERESNGGVRPRAYFLWANRERIERREKPGFVPSMRANGMQPVPVEPAGFTNTISPTWAEMSANSNSFSLFRDGVKEGPYILPVYVDKRSEAKRVLLTPAAATLDAASAGVIAGVILWSALAHSPYP